MWVRCVLVCVSVCLCVCLRVSAFVCVHVQVREAGAAQGSAFALPVGDYLRGPVLLLKVDVEWFEAQAGLGDSWGGRWVFGWGGGQGWRDC